ncbi:hypothetical protein Acr_00g0072290 [Actinidia rufa]|uniref:Uncharacterized protein n=1 Tax=Actinidia rufa TaxID=165716 RepID=A0A7J0DRU1_9ERIC|nr:hypothetical protein Acr_00g0072290 [Actinidia rufa]
MKMYFALSTNTLTRRPKVQPTLQSLNYKKASSLPSLSITQQLNTSIYSLSNSLSNIYLQWLTTPNQSSLSFLILNILLAIAGPTLAGRETPKSSEETDTKQPQSFIGKDPSVLIPGFGRYMHTKKCKGFNPFTYNPITGTNGGTGGVGSTGAVAAGLVVPAPVEEPVALVAAVGLVAGHPTTTFQVVTTRSFPTPVSRSQTLDSA